jgi:hypothetical protein
VRHAPNRHQFGLRSWGGAPGFVILNTKKIDGLSTAVKLYVYSRECRHQWEGPDETRPTYSPSGAG